MYGRPVTFIQGIYGNSWGNLKQITIPNTVQSIGSNAFSDSFLETVIFEEASRLTTIGLSAFEGCLNLSTIIIPDSVTSIGQWAFLFSSVITIVIPVNVTTIEVDAFNTNTIIFSNALSMPQGWDNSVLENVVYWQGEWELISGVPTPK